METPFTHINRLYIGGESTSAQAHEDVVNPATEEVIGGAPLGTMQHAQAAIAAARHAFDPGTWPWLKMSERAEIMRRLHTALLARREQIVALIVAEVGCARASPTPCRDAPLALFLLHWNTPCVSRPCNCPWKPHPTS